MRLKEIEARLAEIKEELNTRAAELTDEEITKLETEVTDLQEERTALLTAAEKRKKLLERIAAGEPTGGAGADTTLLRNFKGAGGAGAGEPEDKYDTTAYRKAFMNYVCRGVAIPAEYRAAETTTTADSGAVIPTTIMNEIIQKLESYGSIYAKVRKINVQGGVSIPIADLKPTAHWITEAKSSDDQKASAKNSVTFNYYGLECKISQSILANVVTLKMFTDLFVPMATKAMVKAIEIAIFNGTGEGQPLGVLKDSRVTAVITLTPEEYASWNGWHKVKGKMKKAYRNGSFVMNQSTFDTGIDGMEDKNGQPIGRTNYGVNGEETYRFMGKNVETVEDDVLPSWDDANEGDVIAVFMNFSDYVINTNMEMQVVKWTDHDNNKIVPRSVWTLGHRPKCSPEGMVYLGGGTWVDIYLNSDDGAKGLKSEYGCAPMTGTESMNWYNFVERLAKSGKRLPNYAEFCAYAFGSPAGLDNANTNAWSATSNTGRGVTGSVVNAVSSVGVVDAVGRVWEWLDELITRAEHATNADYHASVAWGWDKKSPLNTGEKSYDVGNIYQYYAYSLAALVAGGSWSNGARCGARAVHCGHYPWNVRTDVGARGACDSL